MIGIGIGIPSLNAIRPNLSNELDALLAYGPSYAFDFINDQAIAGGAYVGGIANVPGYSFSRASTGFYTEASGVLTSFASGALRRGSRGALIEGARTNLLLRSQEFDNASWTKTRASITADAIAAPDGTTTADKLVEDNTSSSSHFVQQAVSVTNASVYTFSVYVKAAERSIVAIQMATAGFGADINAWFDLSTGLVGTTAGSPTAATIEALANGWYRISITKTATASALTAFRIFLATADGAASYSGDNASGLYIWGAQLEAAAGASSYIPTAGSTATRAADAAVVAGLSAPAAYSLFVEYEQKFSISGNSFLVTFDDNSANNRVALLTATGPDRVLFYVDAGGVNQSAINAGNMTLNARNRQAGRAATNDAAMSVNGAAVAADTGFTMPTTPSRLWLGAAAVGNPWFGYIRRAAIFPRALSNAELQALTA